MKRLLYGAVGAILAFAGSASAQEPAEVITITPELVAAAEAEGSVVVQNSQPLDLMQTLVEAFNREYPKIRVEGERKIGAGGAQSIIDEKAAGVHRVDVYHNGNVSANVAVVDAGVLKAVEPSDNAQFTDIARPLAPYLYYPTRVTTVLMYNPTLVSDEEVEALKKWDAVLDPKFKDRVSLVEPTIGTAMGPLIYIMSQENLGESFLRKVKEMGYPIYLNSAQPREAVVSGEQPISWGIQWDSITISEIRKCAPVEFVYQDPAPTFPLDAWGVVAEAPHPNAARLFFAWIMGKQAAEVMQGKGFNSLSTRSDVEDNRPEMAEIRKTDWYKDPETEWPVDVVTWRDQGDAYLKLWMSIFR